MLWRHTRAAAPKINSRRIECDRRNLELNQLPLALLRARVNEDYYYVHTLGLVAWKSFGDRSKSLRLQSLACRWLGEQEPEELLRAFRRPPQIR